MSRLLDSAQQRLLNPNFGEHPHARSLEAISELLDRNPEIARLAHNDLTREKRSNSKTGRKGMNGDQVVRVLLLKQMHDLPYRELEFHLADSTAFRTFARAPRRKPWKWTTLQSNIKRLQPQTLEAINRVFVSIAEKEGIENGSKIRTDCTAVESNIHEPTESSLLQDGVRVLTRLLRRVKEAVPSADIHFSDHTTRARRRHFAVQYPAKGKKRKSHLRENYTDLLKVAKKTVGYVRTALRQLDRGNLSPSDESEAVAAAHFTTEMTKILEPMLRVIDHTTRRVIHGEKVPANEKVLSLFETHTDIIVKGERDIVFGHKVCLTTGASSLITDCFVEEGNFADSTIVRPALERQISIYGRPPRQASFDGGFASQENLRIAKEDLKVQDVAFHKKCGLKVEDMTRSSWVFRQLRRFRSGIEGIISALKSAGMNRCTWRSHDSLDGFRCYVWSCVLAFNVAVIAKRLVANSG